MTSLPYMPLFVGDYLRDTRHLTTEEHGAYFLLILEYWAKGGKLPDDDAQLARIVNLSPAKWRKVKPIVKQFFQVQDGWHHKRIDEELDYAAARRERARNAANAKHGKAA
jgi:uncharacterized protein YdaU (DUF1376 family)